MKCRFCNRKILSNNAVRLGVCFMCAEIESIIIDGEDMNMPFIKNGYKCCHTKNEKIKLIEKHYPKENSEYWYSFHTKRARKMKLNKIKKYK